MPKINRTTLNEGDRSTAVNAMNDCARDLQKLVVDLLVERDELIVRKRPEDAAHYNALIDNLRTRIIQVKAVAEKIEQADEVSLIEVVI